jgi:addiction module HigA family antidote
MSTLNSHTEATATPPMPETTSMAQTAKVYPAGQRKVAPLHPGEIIADILDGERISRRKAADAIGMSPSGLDKVLNGKGPVTPATALRLGVYFGNGPELWLAMQQDYDLWHERLALGDDLKKIEGIGPLKHPSLG